ncbi:MAG TPA: MlrC C-terminal domain-containing protein, partial [Verrucomicrobiae bacterium]|nr:MlrC C-terminal domain-containing protein [Verrucomicrobiae bacterium]
YADVTEMGSATLVVTDKNHSLACALANELARYGWEHRHAFAGQLVSIEEALQRAIAMRGPVLLLDMGDNVGAGSPADGTALVRAIHERGLGDAFVCLCDPLSVRQVMAARRVTPLRLEMGGRSEGQPLIALCHVQGVYDGKFNEIQARHGGFSTFDQGPTAVVRTDGGITVMLTSRRTPPFSLCQLTAFDLHPGRFRFIIAKGVVAPIAAYKDVCREIIRVNTPGVTCADLRRFTYRHRRRPMYPFEQEANYEDENIT